MEEEFKKLVSDLERAENDCNKYASKLSEIHCQIDNAYSQEEKKKLKSKEVSIRAKWESASRKEDAAKRKLDDYMRNKKR